MSFWTTTEIRLPSGTGEGVHVGVYVWVCMWCLCGCACVLRVWDPSEVLQNRGHICCRFVGHRRGMQTDPVHFSAKRNDDDNASIISVDVREDSGYTTAWGPVGFSRLHHPVYLMVSNIVW